MPRFDQLPDKDASSDEKREAQAQRAKKWGIKAQEDARLTPPADFPQDEEDYADPVNLAFPLTPLERLRNAAVRFSQFATTRYSDDPKGRTIVADRIVEAELQDGITPSESSGVLEYASSSVKKKLNSSRKMDSQTRISECRVRMDGTKRTDEGYLEVPVFATRSDVFVYVDSKTGKPRREWRPPSEVYDDNSMKTLAKKPFTLGHPPTMLTPKNTRKYQRGFVSSDVGKQDNYVTTSVMVTDSEAIEYMESKKMTEVSCGYKCDLEWTSGVTRDGKHYDAIQRNIRYNRLALVDKGRAGRDCKVHLDSNEYRFDAYQVDDNFETKGEKKKMPIEINGRRFDVDEAVEVAYSVHLEKVKQDKDDLEALKTKVSELQGKFDTKEQEAKQLKEKNDSVNVGALVKERLALEKTASRFVKDSVDGLTDRQVKEVVLKSVYPEMKFDDKEDAYINAGYKLVASGAKASDPGKKRTDSYDRALKSLGGKPSNKNDSITNARMDMIQTMGNAWQKTAHYGKAPVMITKEGDKE